MTADFTAQTVAGGFGVVYALDSGELDLGHEGLEVVYGSRYSNSIMASWNGEYGGTVVEVLSVGENPDEPRNIWDIAVGDVLSAAPPASPTGP